MAIEMPEWWIKQMEARFHAAFVSGDRSVQELARLFGCSDDQAQLVIDHMVAKKIIIQMATPPSTPDRVHVYGLVHHGRIVTGEIGGE